MPLPATQDLEPLVGPALAAAGLQLVGLQLLSHRLPLTVQLLIRRRDGGDVNLDDCAAVSAPLGDALEASGLLSGEWVLEVSSPGIGDDLRSDRDFQSFRGFPVLVRLLSASGSPSERQGLLLGRDERDVLLNVRGRRLRLPRQQVLQVRLTSPPADP